ncbi:MAG: hypothetical protein AAF193_05270 [Bacteroidota bacterium]
MVVIANTNSTTTSKKVDLLLINPRGRPEINSTTNMNLAATREVGTVNIGMITARQDITNTTHTVTALAGDQHAGLRQ